MDYKIVDKGVKIDLHIHSKLSSHTDNQKVANNTIENIKDLINGLNKNEVNMCVITDHDTFDFEYYKRVKEEVKGSIQKVFPDVEFSVNFQSNKEFSNYI